MSNQSPASAERSGTLYNSYVLAVLSAVYLVNFLDRQVIATLMPLIKKDFGLSDFELGFLVGPAYGTFYALAGVPIALLGDRFNRRNVIAFAMLFFSLMTIVCGFATMFWHLLVARLITGIGQAGTTPPSTSILSDIYPRERRATAMALFTIGANIGLLASILGGAWVATNVGWREALIWAGIPGLVLTLVMFLTVKEPVRGLADQRVDTADKPKFLTVVSTLFRIPAYRNITIATTSCSIAGFGTLVFAPLFFIRNHGMSLLEISIVVGILWGVAGGFGSFFGGMIADRKSRSDIVWLTRVPVFLSLIPVPFIPLAFLSPNLTVALLALIPLGTLTGAYAPACYSAVATLAPLRMRAMASALFLMVVSLGGTAAAPFFFGWLSDAFSHSFGADGLRYALLVVAPFWALGAVFFWRAGKTLKVDIAKTS